MSGFSDGWPKWAKPVFALAVAAIWIGMPLFAAWSLSARTVQAGGVVDYQPVLVVLVGMTTATITGTFVFMTFRIDRGTKKKAGEVARRAAKKAARRAAKKAAEKELKETKAAAKDAETAARAAEAAAKNARVAAETALDGVVDPHQVDEKIAEKLDTVASPEEIHRKVAEHITKDELREHVKAMLMIDVNAQAITDSAQEHAKSLDPGTILQISEHLKEAADAWAQCIAGEKRTGWRFFGDWVRSRRNG